MKEYNEYMSEVTTCPICHMSVRPTDFFCFNCGKSLHEKPPSMTAGGLARLFVGTIILPPMGIIWGMRYLKQPNQKSKIIGMAAIVLTIVELILGSLYLVDTINKVNEEVSRQMRMIQGF